MDSTHYSVDRRDIRFVQNELLEVLQILESPSFQGLDKEDMALILEEGSSFAETVLAPLNKVGDEESCKLQEGVVQTPKGFKELWKAYAQGGWLGINAPEELGGQNIPISLALGVLEPFYGANPAFYTMAMLTAGSSGLVATFGSKEQKKTFCQKMFSGQWGGTMCLSEVEAGSSVGDITTQAAKAKDKPHYLLRGTKQWISGGNHDMAENIIHLVLGRIEGAPPGPKGISLFIVPKYRLTPEGKPGEFNHVETVRLEHKLGIKASATAALDFGGTGDTHAYLLGEPQQGLAQMFHLMNEARLTVGYQGLGIASGAYRNALSYAKERIQGIPVEKFKEQTAKRVPIVEHPDVRNMLMTMKSLVEGMRGLLYAVGFYSDMSKYGPEEKRTSYAQLADLLIPVAKNMGAEQGFEVVRLGIQVLGGVGFTEEFPLAQALRDCKIASIYEGTSGIQGLDLVTRKLPRENGALFLNFLQHVGDIRPEDTQNPQLKKALGAWGEALKQLQGVVMSLPKVLKELGPRESVFNATDITQFFGDVMMGYYLCKSALVAEKRLAELLGGQKLEDKLQESEELRFYHNKMKTAEHFVFHVLPRVQGISSKIHSRNYAALEAVF